MGTGRRAFLAVFAIVVFCAIAWAARPFWLGMLGNALVTDQTPQKSDAILVLAGDWKGQRILAACELLRKEVAPVVYVSGPAYWYDINEADAAIRFAASRGCDATRLRPMYIKASSTVEEAEKLHPLFREFGIRSLVLVTSNYHTARSARVFRHEFGDELRLTTVAAPDEDFAPENWWMTREGQKTVFFEVSKTLAHWAGF